MTRYPQADNTLSPFADRRRTEVRDSILYVISIFSFLIPLWLGRLRARAW